jgi:hypothetical protein
MPATYDKIEAYTLPSAQAAYTFTTIPGTFTDLVMIISGTNATASDENIWVRFNGDTGSNYSATQLYGTGSSPGSTTNSGTGMLLGRGGTTLSSSVLQFINYANTTTFKTAMGRGNNTNGVVIFNVGLWRSTAAITSIYVTSNAGNFNTGTTFTLYGIKAA